MPVGFTEDQEQFRDVVARFFAHKSPTTAVRALMESPEGYDPEVWKRLSEEVGLAGTHLPEAYGGFGFGAVELGIISQQMGRHLYCGPFFASSVMAGLALLQAGSEAQKQRWLPGIANGSLIAALALDDLDAPERVGRRVRATSNGAAGAKLDGVAPSVVDAHIAELLIVAAGTDEGLGYFAVDPTERGVEVKPLECLDPTRKLARVTLRDVSGERLGGGRRAEIQDLWDGMCTALAHEMLGGAEALFESTIEYMKMRVQFGRAIGSFQALKHRCADLLLELELARAATHAAARYLAGGAGEDYAPNMAKALAGDAYMSIAKQAIQLRGGIGFTWEDDTHLWYKRAKSSEVFLGTPNWHREAMVRKMEASNGRQ